MTITEEQFDVLLGFKLHIWDHYHGYFEGKSDFDAQFWAEKLDAAKVPWSVQNTVAILMETRANGFSGLIGLLKKEGIEVQHGRCA